MSPTAHGDPAILERLRQHLLHFDRAVDMQKARLLSGSAYRGSEAAHKREADILLYVIGIREVRRVADGILSQLSGDQKRNAKAAIAAFDKAVPDVFGLRDVLAHIDKYGRGVGDEQKAARRTGHIGLTEWIEITFDTSGRPDFTVTITGAGAQTLKMSLMEAGRVASILGRRMSDAAQAQAGLPPA